MKRKIALITGITGQDGSYLSEFLLTKGYIVHGIKRRTSSFNTERVDHLYQSPQKKNKNFFLHYGDLSDFGNILNIIKKIKPDEIYNLGAQSHVSVSFELPEYTSDINALGALRILESMRVLNLKATKFYQASTSEMFGNSNKVPQNEQTPFAPTSPYAIAKLYAYWITINYRKAYGLFASNGILFNHESPFRGETFVTRKITRAVTRIYLGLDKCLYIGNLNAKRDWGHAKDFVKAQWLILQNKQPDDFIISTGQQHSVRDFITDSFKYLKIDIKWKNKGLNEIGVINKIDNKNKKTNKIVVVRVDIKYFRPSEVENLLGDSSKAKKILNWKRNYTYKKLIAEMIDHDLNLEKQKNKIE